MYVDRKINKIKINLKKKTSVLLFVDFFLLLFLLAFVLHQMFKYDFIVIASLSFT